MNETRTWQPGPAWLFCPADRPDRYPKALAVADVVILDLEDAVAPERKGAARWALRRLAADRVLDLARTVVRLSSASSLEHAADAALADELALPRVMLAKSEHPDEIGPLHRHGVIALVETARGVEQAGALAVPSNVVGMMWGADDLVASMGGTGSRHSDGTYRDVARFARSRVLTAAKSCGRLALDAVHMDISDEAGLAAESEDAVAVGFDATVAIHPSQLATIRAAYRPSAEQLDRAQRLLAHVGDARGVTTFEGDMVDGPIFRQAERTVRLAELTAPPPPVEGMTS